MSEDDGIVRRGRCEQCGRDMTLMSEPIAVRDADFGPSRLVCKACYDRHRLRPRVAP